jgi:hypothetical protein
VAAAAVEAPVRTEECSAGEGYNSDDEHGGAPADRKYATDDDFALDSERFTAL